MITPPRLRAYTSPRLRTTTYSALQQPPRFQSPHDVNPDPLLKNEAQIARVDTRQHKTPVWTASYDVSQQLVGGEQRRTSDTARLQQAQQQAPSPAGSARAGSTAAGLPRRPGSAHQRHDRRAVPPDSRRQGPGGQEGGGAEAEGTGAPRAVRHRDLARTRRDSRGAREGVVEQKLLSNHSLPETAPSNGRRTSPPLLSPFGRILASRGNRVWSRVGVEGTLRDGCDCWSTCMS